VLPLGPNGYSEYLQPGRVSDCYLGVLLDQPLAEIMPEPGRVLVVAPAALRHREIPQPHGRVLYNLVTGHPERAPHDLAFLGDLTVELRAWPQQTWPVRSGRDAHVAVYLVCASGAGRATIDRELDLLVISMRGRPTREDREAPPPGPPGWSPTIRGHTSPECGSPGPGRRSAG
jgi:hypothetical protein